MEVAALDVLRALAFDRCPGAAVPQHHRAAAIFAPGDHPLEIGIGHRMIFGAHREPLVVWVLARPLGDRPAFENATRLEPELVLEARRVVLLDDDTITGALSDLARAFEGPLELP